MGEYLPLDGDVAQFVLREKELDSDEVWHLFNHRMGRMSYFFPEGCAAGTCSKRLVNAFPHPNCRLTVKLGHKVSLAIVIALEADLP